MVSATLSTAAGLGGSAASLLGFHLLPPARDINDSYASAHVRFTHIWPTLWLALAPFTPRVRRGCRGANNLTPWLLSASGQSLASTPTYGSLGVVFSAYCGMTLWMLQYNPGGDFQRVPSAIGLPS